MSVNKHQYTRAISFNLSPHKRFSRFFFGGEELKIAKINNFTTPKEKLENLIKLKHSLEFALSVYNDLMFFSKEDRSTFLSKNVLIKFSWYRLFYKDEYFNKRYDQKQVDGKAIPPTAFYNKDKIYDLFDGWGSRIATEVDSLSKIIRLSGVKSEVEELPKNITISARSSEINLIIQRLKSDDYVPFFVSLRPPTAKPKSISLEKKLQQAVDELEKNLDRAYLVFSVQSKLGVEFSRASLNYFTVNKYAKKYKDKNPKDLIKEKEDKIRTLTIKEAFGYNFHYLKKVRCLCDINFNKETGFSEYLKEQGVTDVFSLTLDELYTYLKQFKSSSKQKFFEDLKAQFWYKDRNYPDRKQHFIDFINLRHPLFRKRGQKTKNFNDVVEKFLTYSDKIRTAPSKKSRDFRIKRGRLFQGNRYGSFFGTYVGFCDECIKPVAMLRGRLKAEINALRQEEVHARLLKYWALVGKDNRGNYLLLLVPKDRMYLFRNDINQFNNEDNSKDADFVFYNINSLTLRALDKLVRNNYPKEIPNLNQDGVGSISIYQKVLKDNCEPNFSSFSYDKNKNKDKIKLEVPDVIKERLVEISKKTYSSLENFRYDLESVYYIPKPHYLKSDKLVRLIKKHNLLLSKLTSYDLTRNLNSSKKAHTKLWEGFWSNLENVDARVFTDVRLNPELKIFYKKAIDPKDLPKKKRKSRLAKNQVRVQFTLTSNAASKQPIPPFIKYQELKTEIDEFNRSVIDPYVEDLDKKSNLWYYGIDRGREELATLGIVRWTKEKYQASLKDGRVIHADTPKFASFTVYKIKDYSLTKEIVINKSEDKTRANIYKNPSFFMKDRSEVEKCFENYQTSFIDLSMAKLINGRIVVNGDVITYLKLKELTAKRKLLMSPDANLDHKIGIITTSKGIYVAIKNKPGSSRPYTWLTDAYWVGSNKIPKVEERELLIRLNDYRMKVKESLDNKLPVLLIEEINNVRDALTANMIGILYFLFKQFPGIINLENMHSQKEIQSHREAGEGIVHRNLEWSLYKKFQQLGLVPPGLRNTIFLREKLKVARLGVINFIETEGTSTTCPYCGNKVAKKRKKYEEGKFVEHRLFCEHCGFDTKSPVSPLESVSNSDQAASYNIAKRGYKSFSKQTD